MLQNDVTFTYVIIDNIGPRTQLSREETLLGFMGKFKDIYDLCVLKKYVNFDYISPCALKLPIQFNKTLSLTVCVNMQFA